jgi:hypothetical protein
MKNIIADTERGLRRFLKKYFYLVILLIIAGFLATTWVIKHNVPVVKIINTKVYAAPKEGEFFVNDTSHKIHRYNCEYGPSGHCTTNCKQKLRLTPPNGQKELSVEEQLKLPKEKREMLSIKEQNARIRAENIYIAKNKKTFDGEATGYPIPEYTPCQLCFPEAERNYLVKEGIVPQQEK